MKFARSEIRSSGADKLRLQILMLSTISFFRPQREHIMIDFEDSEEIFKIHVPGLCPSFQ